MKACYFNPLGHWTQAGTLWEALDMEKNLENIGKKAPFIIAFAGGGGKTSLIRRMAWEGRERGRKVLVLTTTHMFRPSCFGVLDEPAEGVYDMLQKEHLAVAGHLEHSGKISFQGWEYYREIRSMAELVLIEADGSKRLPVKVPVGNEPVVPEDADLLLCLGGLSAVGRPGEEVCFRLEAARDILEKYGVLSRENRSWILRPQDLSCLMLQGYLNPLRDTFPGMEILPVFNQADDGDREQLGRELLGFMGEHKGIVTGRLQDEPSFSLF